MVLVEPVIDESAGTLTVCFPTESGIDAVVVPLQPSEEELASLELCALHSSFACSTLGTDRLIDRPSASLVLET